jgi:hypothetical protein
MKNTREKVNSSFKECAWVSERVNSRIEERKFEIARDICLLRI